MADIERIEPSRPIVWPRITRHPLDDEPKEHHEPPDEEPTEEGMSEDEDGHPHIDVRV